MTLTNKAHHVHMRKYTIISAILILLVLAIATIYYLAKASFFSYTTGIFWNGTITGSLGCLFLASFVSTIFLIATKYMQTKKYGLLFLMLILSGLLTAVLFSFKPGDSDVWWYGAIAGFFSCLFLVFLVMIGYLALKLTRANSLSSLLTYTKEKVRALLLVYWMSLYG